MARLRKGLAKVANATLTFLHMKNNPVIRDVKQNYLMILKKSQGKKNKIVTTPRLAKLKG